jgi:hypothetical protein
MICTHCEENGIHGVDMELIETTECVPDPSSEYGGREITGKLWVCDECGHEEEYDPEDDSPADLDDDA